jgi:hypothetical protein
VIIVYGWHQGRLVRDGFHKLHTIRALGPLPLSCRTYVQTQPGYPQLPSFGSKPECLVVVDVEMVEDFLELDDQVVDRLVAGSNILSSSWRILVFHG